MPLEHHFALLIYTSLQVHQFGWQNSTISCLKQKQKRDKVTKKTTATSKIKLCKMENVRTDLGSLRER